DRLMPARLDHPLEQCLSSDRPRAIGVEAVPSAPDDLFMIGIWRVARGPVDEFLPALARSAIMAAHQQLTPHIVVSEGLRIELVEPSGHLVRRQLARFRGRRRRRPADRLDQGCRRRRWIADPFVDEVEHAGTAVWMYRAGGKH